MKLTLESGNTSVCVTAPEDGYLIVFNNEGDMLCSVNLDGTDFTDYEKLRERGEVI